MAGSVLQIPTRTDFETRQVDVAHEWLRSNYNEYEPRGGQRPAGFRFRGTQVDAGRFGVSRLQFPMSAHIDLPKVEVLLVAQVASGFYEYAHHDDRVRSHAGESVLVPRLEDMQVSWDPLDIGAVTLSVDDVERVAFETTGLPLGELTFRGGLPVSPQADQHWRGVIGYVTKTLLPNETAASSPLVLAEASRLLAVAMLTAFDNNSLGHVAARDDMVGPAAVRRAVAYIESHPQDELTLTAIAEAARVGPRALQVGFRRAFDTTPTAYARRVRLDAAHQALKRADPTKGDTVAAIAATWGFPHPGRFATVYRDTFGCSPSRTLRG